MKLNKEDLLKLNEINQYLIDHYDYFAEFEEDLVFSKEEMNNVIKGKVTVETIDYTFPGEEHYVEMDPFELIQIFDEIKSLEIISNSFIKTDHRRYYIVDLNDTFDETLFKTFHEVGTSSIDGIEIKLLDQSFLVGLAAIKLKEYDSEAMWGTASQYLSIEVIYKDESEILIHEEESELVKSYIFEIADSTNFSLSQSEIRNPVYDLYDYDIENEDNNLSHLLRKLEPFNEGMDLFISAVQINDPELKFLNFYKVLEYFSPVAVNIEANELMRKKLDAPRTSFENGEFIRSIFELANSMHKRFNDEDLIKAALSSCTDIIGLFEKLPSSLKKKIRKQIGTKNVSYSIDKQKLSILTNTVSKIIYKTRNKVVHAKSNFNATGEEIESTDFCQLNEFMKEASSQAIRWYSRQPDHLKIDINK